MGKLSRLSACDSWNTREKQNHVPTTLRRWCRCRQIEKLAIQGRKELVEKE